MADEFDANERIAGFPLVSIQKALTWVGIVDDRDDLKSVCDALGCGPRQAAGVLDELERHGFVAKEKKRNQWTKTDKGHRLAHHWKPPRRLRPMVERDDKSSPTNQQLEDVPCLLFGSQDDEDVFEEARLHVLFWAEYEGDHLVEVSEFEPDDYDDPESGGTSSRSAYLTPSDARALAAGLQKAADMAEAEIKRREKHPPKHHAISRKREPPIERKAARDEVPPAAPPAPGRVEERPAGQTKKVNRDDVAATIAELRGGQPPRRGRPKKP